MFNNKEEWAYESMACFVEKKYQMPGIENAFAEGSFCAMRYLDMWAAYGRLRDRLGVEDEDKDVEIIISAMEDV